jgi:Flp pilus assembly protein TadB
MKDISDREKKLREREQELEQRALELRLKELDAEINPQPAPFHQTSKYQDDAKLARTLKQDLVTVAKFSGLFVGGLAVVYISQWLAWISVFAVIATAGWLWFEFRSKKSK